jgi:hypothetical protein
MKSVLILRPLLALATCAIPAKPPACHGAVFPLNPTRMAAPAAVP